MISRLLIFSSALSLSACAYLIDTSIQKIEIETPGAHNAWCFVYVDDLKHKVTPPQIINIGKSRKDLQIDCEAPGNRKQSVTIPAKVTTTAVANVTNGVIPGAAWDAASGALFRYPDKVSIDFTNIPPSTHLLPAHNRPDIKQPEEYDLEEFLPSTPRLNRDKYHVPVEVQQRTRGQAVQASPFIGSGTDKYGKGGTAPSIPSSSNASGAPAPLYPGE